jgi:hypothetical protein
MYPHSKNHYYNAKIFSCSDEHVGTFCTKGCCKYYGRDRQKMVTLCNAQTDLQEAVQALLLSSITGAELELNYLNSDFYGKSLISFDPDVSQRRLLGLMLI